MCRDWRENGAGARIADISLPAMCGMLRIEFTLAGMDCRGRLAVVLVLSESSGKVTRKIRLGFLPAALAVDPATGDAYVPIVFRGVVSEFHL